MYPLEHTFGYNFSSTINCCPSMRNETLFFMVSFFTLDTIKRNDLLVYWYTMKHFFFWLQIYNTNKFRFSETISKLIKIVDPYQCLDNNNNKKAKKII